MSASCSLSKDKNNWQRDADYLHQTIKEDKKDQVLVCARTTKQIINVITNTNFVSKLYDEGYSWLVITSKTGALIDGNKVTREEFFNTLNAWVRIKLRSLLYFTTVFSLRVSMSMDYSQSSFSVTWIMLASHKLWVELFVWVVNPRLMDL